MGLTSRNHLDIGEIMNNNMIMKTLFGSHLYGLSTPESDKDYKGIFMPSKEEIVLGKIPRSINESTGDDFSKNTAYDVDYEVFSLHQFIRLGVKGETVIIDMLHTQPDLIVKAESNHLGIFNDLVHLRTMFYSKNMKSYIGYVRKQAHKYGVKGSRVHAAQEALNSILNLDNNEPLHSYWNLLYTDDDYCVKQQENGRHFWNVCGRKIQSTAKVDYAIPIIKRITDAYGSRAKMAEENEGIDWKAVSHAFRAGYQVRDIFTYGDFIYPLRETDFILKVKRGELDFVSEVQPKLEALVDEVMNLSETTDKVPDTVDQKFWDQWLINKVQEFYFNE